MSPSLLTHVDAVATPWEAGRFDGRSGPPRLLFGRTFEDPAIELAHFEAGARVLCIASAGDTARALAAAGCSVLAVDINPAQIDEVRRRLDGHAPHAGAADRLLAVGRTALAPLGWRPSRLAAFCALDDPAEQVRAWRRLTPPLVRSAIRAALAPAVLRVAYGEPFVAVAPRRFGDVLVGRVARRVGLGPNRTNPWLAHLLTGRWAAPDPDPPVGPLELRCADVARVLEEEPAGSLDGISLSNVLDGPGPQYAERLLAAARRAARPGAPIILRSFLDSDDAESRRLADLDRSLLWGGIAVHH